MAASTTAKGRLKLYDSLELFGKNYDTESTLMVESVWYRVVGRMILGRGEYTTESVNKI